MARIYDGQRLYQAHCQVFAGLRRLRGSQHETIRHFVFNVWARNMWKIDGAIRRPTQLGAMLLLLTTFVLVNDLQHIMMSVREPR